MSGGEQRRVAIARAPINSPSLLLADEPTSDLAEDSETDIIDLLEQLQRSHGLVKFASRFGIVVSQKVMADCPVVVGIMLIAAASAASRPAGTRVKRSARSVQ